MKWKDINSIPKEINDYINFRKKIKNTENLFIRSDFIFSREDFITDNYFLCEIILLLTALSENAEIYMIKISDMNTEIQEFWSDILSKYIEVRSIREDDESNFLQTPLGIFNQKSKDKNTTNKIFDVSSSVINKTNNTNGHYDIEEKKNLMKIIDKNKKDIKEQQKIITSLNLQNQEIKKIKDNKIISLEKKIAEYEDEIKKLNQIIKENENKVIKEKKLEEEIKNLKERIIKLANENLLLKTYKEYKSKYESLLLSQKEIINQGQLQNANIENLTETKEKYLNALKTNINIQKENEHLRKEITSLKGELKKRKKENIKEFNNIKTENGKEINYKDEYENIKIKAERYKYLLDGKDKQIEELRTELEKYQNKKTDENGGVNLNPNDNNINNSGLTRIQSKKFKNKNLRTNNQEAQSNRTNKIYSTKNNNTYLNVNQSLTKEEKINKTNKNNSKSEKKKDKALNNKKFIEHNKSNKNRISNNIFPSNNINSDLLNNDILLNPILNLNSSVKIENDNNLENLLSQLKGDDNINNKKEQKNPKNNSINENIKPLLNNIYFKLKKDKKNQNEFFSFLKKVDKELNLDILHQLHQNNSNNNNKNIISNEESFNEQIKDLKRELTQYKKKESETKVKLTFLQSEKIKLESELKKLSQNTPYKSSQKNSMIKKYCSSTKKLNGISSLKINSELSKLTMDFLNNSPTKEKEEESFEKEKDKKYFNEKSIKYSFKRKKLLINKSTSIDNETGANIGERNSLSIFEEESNENGKGKENNNSKVNNDKIIKELNNKINDITNEKNSLEDVIKNLNQNLDEIKLKESKLENINSNLIKENIELKQSLILIKENYENEFNLVSSSLENLTEKYQNMKQTLLKEKNNE